MRYRVAFAALALALIGGAPASAQNGGQSLGLGVHFQGYSFDEGLGVDAANLLLVPVAYQLPIGERLAFDVYGAYARGQIEIGESVAELSGFVDTQARLSVAATPWAVLTLGLNLPTGNATHDSEEALVAGLLSTDFLGFREASFGLGFALTSGVATAYRLGEWGLGVGASYRVASEFEPRADTAIKYTPGNEARARVALDRSFGSTKLTGGVTFQNFSADQLDERDLFQAGNRWRGDLALSFRTGRAATWTAYGASIWRERGDVTLQKIDAQGNVLPGDSVLATASQTLFIAGLAGAVRVGSVVVRPELDFRVQDRETIRDETGQLEHGGEGWVAGGGLEVPFRLAVFDAAPRARLLFGEMEGTDGKMRSMLGGELGFMLRWAAR